MRLYHFTTSENLWLISQRGLEPSNKPETRYQAMGREAVWLTQDINDHYLTKHPSVGDRNVILAVEVERHSKKLVHYPKLLRSHGTSVDKFYDPTKFEGGKPTEVLALWWVHFGTIPPYRLGLKVGELWVEIRDAMTAALALPRH
jgi:hypothetical protein